MAFNIDRQKEEEWIISHSLIVNQALRKCYISYYHYLYEDYRQIAFEELILAHRQALRENKVYLDKYYCIKLVWRIHNEKSKRKKYNERFVALDENLESLISSPEQSIDALNIEGLEKYLSKLELHILTCCLYLEFDAEEISNIFNCSTSKVYKARKTLIEKVRNYIQNHQS